MSDLTDEERESLRRLLPEADSGALGWKARLDAVERIIATRLAAAEARAEAAEQGMAEWETEADRWRDDCNAQRVRAEAAERKVAAVEAVLDDQHKPFRFKADDLRTALDTAADPDTPTPTRWEVG